MSKSIMALKVLRYARICSTKLRVESPSWVDNGPPMKKSERPLFQISVAAPTPTPFCAASNAALNRPMDCWSTGPRPKNDASH
jgi:hypothetical protein